MCLVIVSIVEKDKLILFSNLFPISDITNKRLTLSACNLVIKGYGTTVEVFVLFF